MNKVDLIKALISDDEPKTAKAHTFLKIGKPHAFRTVTMIFTGILIDVSEQEFLVDEAAWIPETERWMDFVENCAVKECEPYSKPIVINRGALVDAVEIPKVIRKQK